MEFQNKNIFNLLDEDDNISIASSNDSKINLKTENKTPEHKKKVFHHKKSLLNNINLTQQTSQQNSRENALNILSNKEILNKELAKTKLCNSVSEGKVCPYKEKCRFAHSVDELVIKECLFGERCIYVFKKNNVWNNKPGKKICFHRHTEETNDNYLIRSGLKEGNINDLATDAKDKLNVKPEINPNVNPEIKDERKTEYKPNKNTKTTPKHNKILHVSPHVIPTPPLDTIHDDLLLPPPVIGISTFYSAPVCATTIFASDYGKKMDSSVFPETITITIKNDEELYIKLEEALENGYRDINIKVA